MITIVKLLSESEEQIS